MATEKWIAGSGVGLTWTDVGVSTSLNSLASGNAVICTSSTLDNSTALDIFMDLSVSLGSVTPGAGAPYIGFYLVPTNQDGTSWGDGRFGSAAAGPPPSSYWIGNIPCIASTAGVITGMIRDVILPVGTFKLVAYNQAGVALAASANVVKYRTKNRSVA